MSDSNGAVQAYIHDGYTRDGYIAEIPRLYPAVRFIYRPVLAEARAVVYRAVTASNDAARAEKLAAAAIKRQLVSWDIVKHNGKAVLIDVDSILRLAPSLLARLYSIVGLGSEAPDEDPDFAGGHQEQDVEAELENAIVGTTAEEADAKNSEPG